MPGKNKRARSPRLVIDVTPKRWERAKQSHSGACLLADAIRDAYPHLSAISVNAMLISATDKAAGERYTYLTPPQGIDLLLAFDQGWSQPETHRVTCNGAVKVTRIRASNKAQTEHKRARTAELEAKEAANTITPREAGVLKRLHATAERSASAGPITDVLETGRSTTIVGGKAPKALPKHPNLLAGKARVFGAKLAQPDEIFRKAVEVAAAEEAATRVAELEAQAAAETAALRAEIEALKAGAATDGNRAETDAAAPASTVME